MSQLVLAQSRDVLTRHARSFRWAAWFLRDGDHDDAAVVYAFCRAVDDAVDEHADPHNAARALGHLERELQRPDAPGVVGAFQAVADRRGFGLRPAEELMEGVRTDLARVRIPDVGGLVRYAYLVAGTVGLMMCGVLGVTDPRARRHAIDLGIAMQITNICRDVREDAERGRVYLPATLLASRGVSQEQLVSGDYDTVAVSEVVDELLELAEVYYANADLGMSFIPIRARLAIVIASRLYRAIGLRLRARHHCDPSLGRVVVPWWSKLAWTLAGASWWLKESTT